MPDDLPVFEFPDQQAFEAWLEEHHADSPGLWLKIAKRGGGATTVSYPEAVESALCFGWIDGQKGKLDDAYFLQRFTPRKPKSVWSKINREKVAALTKAGRMRPAGQAEVDKAKADGRWDAAYDSPSTATVPDDLAAALAANPQAQAEFERLNSTNRYAILWRVQTAKKAETRVRRIAQFVDMLARGERPY